MSLPAWEMAASLCAHFSDKARVSDGNPQRNVRTRFPSFKQLVQTPSKESERPLGAALGLRLSSTLTSGAAGSQSSSGFSSAFVSVTRMTLFFFFLIKRKSGSTAEPWWREIFGQWSSLIHSMFYETELSKKCFRLQSLWLKPFLK